MSSFPWRQSLLITVGPLLIGFCVARFTDALDPRAAPVPSPSPSPGCVEDPPGYWLCGSGDAKRSIQNMGAILASDFYAPTPTPTASMSWKEFSSAKKAVPSIVPDNWVQNSPGRCKCNGSGCVCEPDTTLDELKRIYDRSSSSSALSQTTKGDRTMPLTGKAATLRQTMNDAKTNAHQCYQDLVSAKNVLSAAGAADAASAVDTLLEAMAVPLSVVSEKADALNEADQLNGVQ